MPLTIRIRRGLIEDLPVIGDLPREAEREAIEKGVEKGLKKGLKEGLQKGIQKGIKEGLQKGLQKGLQEGLVKAKQEDIIKVLEAKFGKLSKTINSKIKKINDLNKLEALLLEAVKFVSLEEFKTKL
jgi:flagellar biosynthesis/type III secretory pathway protein FliH